MRRINWQIVLGTALIALSAVLYAIHYAFFHDTHHIFIYLLGDIAFVPIEVLLVTLIIHRLLSARERRSVKNKLNMVIGAFFSEVGTELIHKLTRLMAGIGTVGERLIVRDDWSKRSFTAARRMLRGFDFQVSITASEFSDLREYLVRKRAFMLRLLENQSLLEHESFSDLLWATFHLTEELERRGTIVTLPEADLKHLEGDVRRVCRAIMNEWIMYLHHLKWNYPYLFSLSVRTNPFDPNASPIISA